MTDEEKIEEALERGSKAVQEEYDRILRKRYLEVVNSVTESLMSDPVNITLSGPAPEGLVTEEEFAERISVTESPFVTVDTESQFDKALQDGKSMVLRGEGSGGIVDLTNPKTINHRFTTITGNALLRFTLDQTLPGYLKRGITVHADDVTLSNFELISTQPVATNDWYGIAFSEGSENHGHRLKLLNLHIHNWGRCISKDGSHITTTHSDVVINNCYFHTFRYHGAWLEFGMQRLCMRDTRIIGRLPGETHATHQAMRGGTNWEDCLVENCLFKDVSEMGLELMVADYQYYHRRSKVRLCRSENCGSMGFSTGFGEGLVIEKCVAKNVKWIGFEFQGRPPEYNPSGPYRYSQGIMDGCEVDGVTSKGPDGLSGSGQAIGFSIDGARDTSIRGGTRISNITAPLLKYGASGIVIASSERVSVQGTVLTDCGHVGIMAIRGDSPNTRGFHELSGNTFRKSVPDNTAAEPAMHFAIYIADTSSVVRNNTSYQKTGTTLNFGCNVNPPAQVLVDNTVVGYGEKLFAGSNVIFPVS